MTVKYYNFTTLWHDNTSQIKKKKKKKEGARKFETIFTNATCKDASILMRNNLTVACSWRQILSKIRFSLDKDVFYLIGLRINLRQHVLVSF